MDNGHVYPSDYAFRFGEKADHPATYHALVDDLKRHHHFDWPRLLGLIFSRREACMVAALRALDAALAEPKMTRVGLRRRMLASLAAIAERGPEAIPPRGAPSG